ARSTALGEPTRHGSVWFHRVDSPFRSRGCCIRVVSARSDALLQEAAMSGYETTTRRRFLLAGTLGPVCLAVGGRESAWGETLPPPPACGGGHEAATLRQSEGPFFKPRSPERFDLREAGIKGDAIELVGFVLTPACRPLAHALVDLWHADG